MFGMPNICGFGSCTAPAVAGARVIVEFNGDEARFRVCQSHIDKVKRGSEYSYLPSIKVEVLK